MRRVKNWLNAEAFPTIGEINRKPSMTVPDQTMSMREILDRFARGLPLGGMKTPIFDEDDDMPDMRTLDLAERQELSEMYAEELDGIRLTREKNEAEKALKRDAAEKKRLAMEKAYEDSLKTPDPTNNP